MIKYAIFGGSFNPPHIGHNYIVEQYHKLFPENKIFVIPSHIPPHKKFDKFLSDETRLLLTKMMFKNKNYCIIDDFELLQGGTSYSIDTIQYLYKKHDIPKKIDFILGDDLLKDIELWRNFKELNKLVNFICFTRYGKNKSKYAKYFPIEPLNISSTEIRKIFREKTDKAKLEKWISSEMINIIDKSHI